MKGTDNVLLREDHTNEGNIYIAPEIWINIYIDPEVLWRLGKPFKGNTLPIVVEEGFALGIMWYHFACIGIKPW